LIDLEKDGTELKKPLQSGFKPNLLT